MLIGTCTSSSTSEQAIVSASEHKISHNSEPDTSSLLTLESEHSTKKGEDIDEDHDDHSITIDLTAATSKDSKDREDTGDDNGDSIDEDNDQLITTNSIENEIQSRLCNDNQYAKSLSLPESDYEVLMDTWIEQRYQHYKDMMKMPDIHDHNWNRFNAFEVMGSCQTKCIGGRCGDDTSKIACGIDEGTMEAPCVIYSLGGNNQWEFELELLDITPCEIHTFDCTGPLSRFKKPDNDRLHFHHVCIGTENLDAPEHPGEGTLPIQGEFWTLEKAQQTLQHSRVDLLKLDIEGFEWPLFESWPTLQEEEALATVLPMQILVEIHYQTQFAELRETSLFEKLANDMIHLETRFLQMGYVVVNRDDNVLCKHCTELTLVRIRCS